MVMGQIKGGWRRLPQPVGAGDLQTMYSRIR